MNIPIGVGVKYKATPRINIGCEFTMRFSLSDQLDVTQREGLQLEDPYQIKGKGWKNKIVTHLLFFSSLRPLPKMQGM